ncbi:MAG TPA: DUF6188 family protein [Ktedonobacterales bacterium]
MNHQRSVDISKPQLAGFSVLRCIVDFAFTLHLVKPEQAVPEQEEALLRIEEPFEVILDGVRFQFDSQRDLVGLGRALTLFRRVVDTAVIDSDGGLEVTFVDHTVLRVPSNPDFEYWNLDGPHGVLIVAGPGDRVSVFR